MVRLSWKHCTSTRGVVTSPWYSRKHDMYLHVFIGIWKWKLNVCPWLPYATACSAAYAHTCTLVNVQPCPLWAWHATTWNLCFGFKTGVFHVAGYSFCICHYFHIPVAIVKCINFCGFVTIYQASPFKVWVIPQRCCMARFWIILLGAPYKKFAKLFIGRRHT